MLPIDAPDRSLRWLAVVPTIALAVPEGSPELGALIDVVSRQANAGQATGYMCHIYCTDRWFTFPKFQETAAYIDHSMKQIGLQKVETLAAPADGVSQFGYWTMPLAWEVKQARLEIVNPVVPLESRVLAEYEEVPTSLGMWSGPTGPTPPLDSFEPRIRTQRHGNPGRLSWQRQLRLELEDLPGRRVDVFSEAGPYWLLASDFSLQSIRSRNSRPEFIVGG